MHLLLASIAPLILGPALVWLLRRARWAANAIDAFVLVSVAGLVLLSILPQTIAEAGVAALVAVAAGTALPMLGGRVFSAKPSVRSATLVLGLLGLALHATLDGVALAAHDHGHDHHGAPLAFAVVLHRLPVGLAIWWLVRPRAGARIAIAAVAAIVLASVLGFVWAHEAHAWMHGAGLAVFQALVAGSLLHVAAGHSLTPEKPTKGETWRIPSAVGGLLGVAVVFTIAQAHPLPHAFPSALGFSETFLTLASRGAPALLAAYACASLFHTALPRRFGTWLRGRSPLSQAFRGVSAGVPTDACSCTINPSYESLVRSGVPPSAAIAFLVAAPMLGVSSVLLTLLLLGPAFTAGRVVAAALLALLVGAVLGRVLTRVAGQSIPPAAAERPPWPTRISDALHYGFIDVADRTLPWFFAGLIAASLVEPMLDPATIASVPDPAQVPVLAALGIPVFLCAAGSTPLIAVLAHKGVSAGALVALLLTGPAVNRTTFSLLRQLHGTKVAFAFGIVVAGGAVGLGLAVNVLLPPVRPDLHAMAASSALPEFLALGALGLLTLWSLLRQGAHGFVSQVVELHDHLHHDHGEGRHHHHGNEPAHRHAPSDHPPMAEAAHPHDP